MTKVRPFQPRLQSQKRFDFYLTFHLKDKTKIKSEAYKISIISIKTRIYDALIRLNMSEKNQKQIKLSTQYFSKNNRFNEKLSWLSFLVFIFESVSFDV